MSNTQQTQSRGRRASRSRRGRQHGPQSRPGPIPDARCHPGGRSGSQRRARPTMPPAVWRRDGHRLHGFYGRVDAVSIVVPSSMHYEVARGFLKQNVHVLVEKPITVAKSEAQRLIELAKSRNLVLQVGHLERFNPGHHRIAQAFAPPLFLQSYRTGPRINRSLDVGVIWDLMIHDLDIMLNLVKSDLVDISAVGQCIHSKRRRFRPRSAWVFANGCVASLVASRGRGPATAHLVRDGSRP